MAERRHECRVSSATIGLGGMTSASCCSSASLQSTENKTDLALEGEGFFKIQLYDGTFAYTRDGSFKIDSNRQVVTSNGYLLEPPVVLPDNFIHETLAISQDGRITVKIIGEDDPIEVGSSRLPFVNPAGLARSAGTFSRPRPPPVRDSRTAGMGGMAKTTRASGDVEREGGRGDGEHDRRPARLRDQLQGYPDLRFDARHGDRAQAVGVMRKLLTATAVAMLLVAPAVPSSAAVSVYLVSRAELGPAPVLGDVASIDAAPELRKALSALTLPERVLSDEFVDRREVEDMLAGVAHEAILVYGNAVRVSRMVKEEPAPENTEPAFQSSSCGGRTVSVRVKKTVSSSSFRERPRNGAHGDEVAVKLKSSRTLKAGSYRKISSSGHMSALSVRLTIIMAACAACSAASRREEHLDRQNIYSRRKPAGG